MAAESREAGGVSELATVQPVERREWWPHSLVDEEMPVGRETPDDWLVPYGLDTDAHVVDECEPRALTEGDVVSFTACDTLGCVLMDYGTDDEPVWAPAVPACADHFWDGEEIITNSAEDFAEQARVLYGPGEALTVHLSRWPGDAIRFRFTALDGPPRFLPIDPVPAPPGIFLAPPTDPQTDLFASPAEGHSA